VYLMIIIVVYQHL